MPVRPLSHYVAVDFNIYGCPIDKKEFLEVFRSLILGKKPNIPDYPICNECRMAENICVFERGLLCMGPVTRAGCGAICPAHGLGCCGCRGMVDKPFILSHRRIMAEHGVSEEDYMAKLREFNGYYQQRPMKNLNIKIDNVTRIEGHGNIVLDVKDGQLLDARFDVVESPRFFEVMLQGRRYTDASWIASRICGICAVTHTTASIRATEDAFGLAPSEQTIALRKLIFHGEVMQSHILHLYFLMAPDFFGAGSVISLAGTHGEVVKRALRMKGLANDICAVVGGRHVHPVTMAVNGFTCVPSVPRLRELMRHLVEARSDMNDTVELFKGFVFPDFTRETEYVSLKGVDEYPFYSGDITSSDGYDIKPRDYKDRIVETVVPTSTAKRASANRGSYMVGALARFNNNHRLLHPKAREAAKALGLTRPLP